MNNRKKLIKRVISAVLAVAIVIGAVAGISIWRKGSGGTVMVYQMSDVASTWYGEEDSMSYGTVRSDKIQSVYLSDTQTITEVYVKEGQTVKAGEPILSYDTTLTDIDLERKELSIQKLQLQKEDLEKQVKTGKRPSAPPEEGSSAGGSSGSVVPGESSGIVSEPEEPSSSVVSEPEEPSSSVVSEPEEPSSSVAPEEPSSGVVPGESSSGIVSEPEEPSSSIVPEPEEPITVVEDYYVLGGNGSKGTPMFIILAADYTINTQVLDELLLQGGQNWLIFLTTQDNLVDGAELTRSGMIYKKEGNGTYSLSFFDPSGYARPDAGEDDGEDDGGFDDGGFSWGGGGSGESDRLTSEEIAEKKRQIKELDIQIRLAEVELEQMKNEKNNDEVICSVDGTVASVLTVEEAKMEGAPLIKITGGGGYFISCSINELQLDEIAIGDTVQVMGFESGGMYEGEISAISDTPTDDGDYYGGNANVSYYPFTVTVPGDAQLQDYEYCQITRSSGGEEESGGGFYLDNMFILTEGSKNYVYVRGEDGLLEKRRIGTGKIQWGMTEITGGLTMDDWVAFPYGKAIKDGAKTSEGTMSDLYGY